MLVPKMTFFRIKCGLRTLRSVDPLYNRTRFCPKITNLPYRHFPKDPNSENVVLQLIRQNPGSWKIDLQLFGIFVVKNDLISPYKTTNFQNFPPAAGQILQIVDLQLTRQNNFYQFANLQLSRWVTIRDVAVLSKV